MLEHRGAVDLARPVVLGPAHGSRTARSCVHSGPNRDIPTPADLPPGDYPDAPRRATTIDLPPGSTMLLYTDGLIERRDRPLLDGVRLLHDETTPGSADELCSRITTRLLPDQGITDDVAVLAISLTD